MAIPLRGELVQARMTTFEQKIKIFKNAVNTLLLDHGSAGPYNALYPKSHHRFGFWADLTDHGFEHFNVIKVFVGYEVRKLVIQTLSEMPAMETSNSPLSNSKTAQQLMLYLDLCCHDIFVYH